MTLLGLYHLRIVQDGAWECNRISCFPSAGNATRLRTIIRGLRLMPSIKLGSPAVTVKVLTLLQGASRMPRTL